MSSTSSLVSLLTSRIGTETASTTAPRPATDATTTSGSRWLEDETKTLILVWGEDNVQSQLDGAVRNKTIYGKIAKEMKDHGYTRDWVQCRNKIKNLKKEYRIVKDNNDETGRARKTCKFFDELDEILGHRPASTPAILLDTGDTQDISEDQVSQGSDIGEADTNGTYTVADRSVAPS